VPDEEGSEDTRDGFRDGGEGEGGGGGLAQREVADREVTSREGGAGRWGKLGDVLLEGADPLQLGRQLFLKSPLYRDFQS
jgi:hypothetical protein